MTAREPRIGTLAARIIDHLRSHPDGASDTELEIELAVRHHAHVNQVCNGLAASGRIMRLKDERPFVNRLVDESDGNGLPANDGFEPERGAEPLGSHVGPVMPSDSAEFEEAARDYFSRLWGADLQPRSVSVGGSVAKKFDLVSADGRIIGDAKWYKNIPVPAAKFSTIAEYVWLLQKVEAERRFMVFGQDEEVPVRWLSRFGALVNPIEFYFFDGATHRQLWPVTTVEKG